jgi:uncharacterized protein (TIGR03084 family)
MSAVDPKALYDDVLTEHEVLATRLRASSADSWDLPTPAPGWSIRDQISHLAYFDDAARMAVSDPGAFVELRQRALADIEGFVDAVRHDRRSDDPAQLLAWWRDERRLMVEAFRAAEPSRRVPWFGPDMTVASQATARLMETWAHGQDVADALGLPPVVSARLRHVAHLGVRAFANSFRSHGLAVPDTAVRVELAAPDGGVWTWGPPDAIDRVSGPALDFCMMVTQRRHLADTALHAAGDVARRWVSIAQAFAGPPGPGREPGQFAAPAAARPSEPGTP